jgi:hypothetical protein
VLERGGWRWLAGDESTGEPRRLWVCSVDGVGSSDVLVRRRRARRWGVFEGGVFEGGRSEGGRSSGVALCCECPRSDGVPLRSLEGLRRRRRSFSRPLSRREDSVSGEGLAGSAPVRRSSARFFLDRVSRGCRIVDGSFRALLVRVDFALAGCFLFGGIVGVWGVLSLLVFSTVANDIIAGSVLSLMHCMRARIRNRKST